MLKTHKSRSKVGKVLFDLPTEANCVCNKEKE